MLIEFPRRDLAWAAPPNILILAKRGMSLHVVCPVSADGQQGGTADHHDEFGRDEAITKARDLVVPDGRIFVKDQDSGEWHQIVDSPTTH